MPGSLGGLDGGIAGHEGDAAGITAQVHRSKVGVTRDDANVKGINPQYFGNDIGQDGIRSLPNLRRAAKDAHATAAVELQLHARVRQVVPVDRRSRSTHVSAGREANALAVGKLAEPLFPPRAFHHLVDTLAEARGADL